MQASFDELRSVVASQAIKIERLESALERASMMIEQFQREKADLEASAAPEAPATGG